MALTLWRLLITRNCSRRWWRNIPAARGKRCLARRAMKCCITRTGWHPGWQAHHRRNRMKAVLFHTHGGPDVLEYTDFPTPEPGEGQVLVKLEAAALNRVDIWTRDGWPRVQAQK